MSRRLLFFCSIGAGVCALLGFLVATYAVLRTPSLSEIPVYTDQGILRSANKVLYLYWPVFVQVVLFGVSLFHSIRWDAFKQNILRSAANYNAEHSSARHVDVERLYKILCYAIVGFEVVIMALVTHNAIQLLNLRLAE